ncbi:MAG: nicotinate phosphoribosyltransferase [Candidatus Izemoplasma sp.]|nr:nicotinate phosphoribosyltransferase [Candidatus Izemoplasma sp.]
MNSLNEAMVIDFYEVTMAYGYFKAGKKDQEVIFDLFFRKIPDRGGYAIFAGLHSIIQYIKDFHFNDEDIAYFESRGLFDADFIEYLKNLRFTGDIYAFNEGSVVFPNEPLLTIKAPIIEAQLIETFLLLVVNHQSLIATKAARIKYAAKERKVLEMGARRAHGVSSSLYGTRSAYIGGIDATSNVVADQKFKIKALGTMAHSWIQMFDSEYEAMKVYANTYPHDCTLLIDTYDTLKKGIPNAIKVIKEVLVPKGIKKYAIRIDSGDLTYLAKQARQMLDDAGLNACQIVVSNSLDEFTIKELLSQGAPIDLFGVGERLITAKTDPVLGSVYKLAGVCEDGYITPKIKVSDNVEKITTPDFKKVYRIYSKDGKAEADLLTLHDEILTNEGTLTIFDPNYTWKQKTFEDYTIKSMHETIFKDGELVYDIPDIETVKAHANKEKDTLWDEVKRFEYPHKYYVDLSLKLWKIKDELLKKKG